MSLIKGNRDFVILDTHSLARRVVVSVIVAAMITPVMIRSYAIFRSDRVVKFEQTLANYSRALKYAPANAVFWWHRGRLRHYSVDNVDIAQAIQDQYDNISVKNGDQFEVEDFTKRVISFQNDSLHS